MTLDLTGKHFGKLTAVRPDKNQNGRLGRRWVCRCDCGQKMVVRTRDLRTGNTRSCGCLRREMKCERYFNKRRSKEQYREEVFADGQWWYSPRKAAHYLDVERHTLSKKWRWRCPWRSDRGISTRDFDGPYGNLITYYLRDHLDEIKQARDNSPPTPEFPGLIPFSAAAEALGWTERTLRKRMKAKGLKSVRRIGKRADGLEAPRAYVHETVLDEFKRMQSQSGSAPGKITIAEAAEILGRKPSTVRTLITRGIFKPEGRERRRCKSGQVRGLTALSRAAVEKYWEEHGGHFGHAEGGTLEEAKTVLLEILGDGGPHLRSEVTKEAAERGVGYKRLKRAKKSLRVITERPRRGRWYWKMPAISLSQNGKGAQAQDKTKPGRPVGSTNPKVKKRREKMILEWDEGKFQGNKSEAGRAHGFHRSDATKIINEHEKVKQQDANKDKATSN